MGILNTNNIEKANTLVDSMNNSVTIKKLKKDKGLIERKDNSNKIILAEDNRQVIFG